MASDSMDNLTDTTCTELSSAIIMVDAGDFKG